MSEYRLTIVRIDENPNYDEEKAVESRRYSAFAGHNPYNETPTIEARTLACVISETELTTIKQALLEVWK